MGDGPQHRRQILNKDFKDNPPSKLRLGLKKSTITFQVTRLRRDLNHAVHQAIVPQSIPTTTPLQWLMDVRITVLSYLLSATSSLWEYANQVFVQAMKHEQSEYWRS